jgi:hypothetical protein
MTKIKNFRIQLRGREVARLLKNRIGMPLDPAQEASIEPALGEARKLVRPASLYSTLTRQTAVNAVPFELPKKAVALSAICATIGSGLAELREKAEAAQDTARTDLLSIIEHEALQQATTFALRLVSDQAKKEDCELTDAQDCQEPETRQKLATLLSLDRIDLSLSETDAALPAYSRLIYVVWMPAGKSASKKTSSKPSVKSRPEKAAL